MGGPTTPVFLMIFFFNIFFVFVLVFVFVFVLKETYVNF